MKQEYVLKTTFILLVLLAILMPWAAVRAEDVKTEILEPHVRPDNMNAMFERGMLHGKVEAAFLFNENLSVFDIDTSIHKHTARLEGTVSSELEKDLATQVALNVEGIDEVDNRLRVNDEKAEQKDIEKIKEAVTDVANEARIITAIESKLAVNGHLSGLGVSVNANGSNVILSGTVTSPLHKQLAELIALNTDGVNSVDNQLRVKPES